MPLSVPSTYQRHRRNLGQALRSARQSSGLSGNQLAHQLGWAQSKVSRIETGKQLPTDSDLEAWCCKLRLPKGEQGQLMSLLQQAESEYRSWKDSYRLAGGAAGKQQQILLFEKSSKVICEFQPSLIPGLLQTAQYARELLYLPFGPKFFGADDADIEKMIQKRIERQSVIYNPQKNIEIIILESGLRTRVCSQNTLYEQLIRLIDLCSLRSLNLSVVPIEAEIPLIPLGGYTIFDNDMVILETLSGEQQLSLPEEIELYQAAFKETSKVAIQSQGCAKLISKIADEIK